MSGRARSEVCGPTTFSRFCGLLLLALCHVRLIGKDSWDCVSVWFRMSIPYERQPR
ncbi:hypothetical protein WN48_05001 [Eufriesea mexicana]|nr:hypothetical protein WN48_05001 [Eufriesea mexicana]